MLRRARRELLAHTGYAFEVMAADIDEPQPVSTIRARSCKRSPGSRPPPSLRASTTGLILAADTIGWINDHPILKPTDEADARRILREMCGREHELWTGVVLWRRPDDLQIAWQEQTRVAVAPLSDAELDAYLATRSWRRPFRGVRDSGEG